MKKVKKQHVPVARAKPDSQHPDKLPSDAVKVNWPPRIPPPRVGGAGNIFHGKPKYDPVYPRVKVPVFKASKT